MYQNKAVSDLSHCELSNAMKELNLNVGPITSSTRKIYENRLKSHLKQESRKNDDGDREMDSTDSKHVHNGKSIDQVNITETSEGKPEKPKLELCTTDQVDNDTNEVVDDNPCDKDSMYVGVWVPYSPTRLVDKTKPNVFRSREDALKKVKEYRGSRFKSFSSRSDAESFSLTLPSPYSVDNMCAFIAANCEKSAEPPKTIIKGPSFQELMKFRRSIEEADIQFVQQCLSNPKYLISSSDMPTILQEGTRLNAIHIAVKYNKLNMCRHIMQTIQSSEFLSLMYPDSSDDHISFRKRHLMDLYLNTPDKILCETPLHIASKFGFPSIVEYLLSFKELNVNAKNKDGKMSADVICCRINARGEKKLKLAESIKILFEDKVFIPLYQINENIPKVGQPIITVSKDRIGLATNNIKAYAGPMSPEKASLMYGLWKKSPRSKLYSQIAGTDYEKGMERIGRAIALKENVPFAEYWHFLSAYTDLSSLEGLKKLENYLRIKTELVIQENREADKRKSFSSSSKHSQSRIIASPDEVKRKLTFEFHDEQKSQEHTKNDEKLNDAIEQIDTTSSKLNHAIKQIDTTSSKINHVIKQIDTTSSNILLRINNGMADCYCSCGQLLEYCDKCTVDINIEALSVTFKTCSPPQVSLSSPNCKNNGDSAGLVNGVVGESFSNSFTVESNGILNDSMVEGEKPNVFIDGNIPSKHDLDVLRALGQVVIESKTYPYIEQWKELVESYPDQLKTSWPSPGSPRYPKTLKRNVLWTA